MELSHLSDNELIDYIIKHDTDPVRVRLATYMQRVPGAIIDDLEAAGMDSTFCTFMTEWGSERLPGQYINHLEEEIKIRDGTIAELQEELEQQKARTIVDLIGELKQQIKTAEWMAEEARRDRDKAEGDHAIMKSKLSMWTKLNGQGL
jgi:hypothetical protein